MIGHRVCYTGGETEKMWISRARSLDYAVTSNMGTVKGRLVFGRRIPRTNRSKLNTFTMKVKYTTLIYMNCGRKPLIEDRPSQLWTQRMFWRESLRKKIVFERDSISWPHSVIRYRKGNKFKPEFFRPTFFSQPILKSFNRSSHIWYISCMSFPFFQFWQDYHELAT